MHVSGISSNRLSIFFSAIFMIRWQKSVAYTVCQEKIPEQGHFLPFHSLMACMDGQSLSNLIFGSVSCRTIDFGNYQSFTQQSTNNWIDLRHGHILFTTQVVTSEKSFNTLDMYMLDSIFHSWTLRSRVQTFFFVIFVCLSMITLRCSTRRSIICWDEFKRVDTSYISSWFGTSSIFWRLCSSAVMHVECLN